MVGARRALDSLQQELLPPEVASRLFSKADLDYVASIGSAPMRQLFLRQRRKVALLWVAQLKTQVQSLRRFHLGRARYYSGLSLKRELVLALRFAELLLACRILRIVLHLPWGYRGGGMVTATARIAVRVCATSEFSLSFLGHAKAGPLRDRANPHAMM